MTRISRRMLLAASGAALLAPHAFAQTYPAKPITIVVGFQAGGS